MRNLRGLALAAAVIGALGSLGLTLYQGRHNASWLLVLIFAVWVVAPFAALTGAAVYSKRAVFYSLMPVIAVVSLVAYGIVVFGPPRAQPAFVFLVVPAVSLALIGAGAWWSRR